MKLEDKDKNTSDIMGRIKTTMIKNIGEKLYKEHKSEFTTDFEKNKEIVKKHVDIPSKKLRNVVSGYITRLKKKEEES
jgi:small subunit ribosomal protein S17e